MRRAAAALLLVATLAILPAAAARGAAGEWRSEQPVATGIGVPVPLGPVGDIDFWAPNRGLLITGGNSGMPAGLYAYDGTGWRLYSTVCGGREGRIAWAGPTEFWTVSAYQLKQEGATSPDEEQRRTLCHFKDGAVVASYAEPLATPGTYLPITAAACAGPSNCWFGGQRLSGDPNVGAFHLHWDGAALTALPSLTESQPPLNGPGRSVEDLAFHGGQLFETVKVQAGDQAPEETEPSLIHRVDLAAAPPFVPLFPTFASGSSPTSVLGGLRFAGDGLDLWAVAGSTKGPAPLTLLRHADGGQFTQVPLLQADPPILAPGESVKGVAAEPGGGGLWVGVCKGSCPAEGGALARLVRIGADGSVGPEVPLPGPADEIGSKGIAGPIACPAAGQCWMATSKGWLFHLGGSLPADADPAMRQLITQRPCDNSCPAIPPVGVPEDDSGELDAGPTPVPPVTENFPSVPPSRALVFKIRKRVLDGAILELTFSLRARARVQLLAKRDKKVVAKTPQRTFGKGRHKLRLRLDPDRWPTALDFDVHKAGKKAA